MAMIDKRQFYAMLNGLKEFYPDSINILESITEGFTDIPSISESELRALKQYPIQFVKRIQTDDGEWTTQLHIWAENGVSEILDLDPIYLGFKNSYGDSVLMSVAVAATGTHTGHPDYELLEKMLSKDYSYTEPVKKDDGEYEEIPQNAMEETDIHGQRPIDYIMDVAYATGQYADSEPDPLMQSIISKYTQQKKEIQETDTPIESNIDSIISDESVPNPL